MVVDRGGKDRYQGLKETPFEWSEYETTSPSLPEFRGRGSKIFGASSRTRSFWSVWPKSYPYVEFYSVNPCYSPLGTEKEHIDNYRSHRTRKNGAIWNLPLFKSPMMSVKLRYSPLVYIFTWVGSSLFRLYVPLFLTKDHCTKLGDEVWDGDWPGCKPGPVNLLRSQCWKSFGQTRFKDSERLLWRFTVSPLVFDYTVNKDTPLRKV